MTSIEPLYAQDMVSTKPMKQAIALSDKNLEDGFTPFGAVVVKDGEIIAAEHNRVGQDNDPSALCGNWT